MLKKVLTLVSIFSFLFIGAYAATDSYAKSENAAQKKIAVTFNGEVLTFAQDPIEINGTTLVPMRTIFQKLGYTIEWKPDTQTVIAKNKNKEIILKVEDKKAYVNGILKTLAVPTKNLKGNTLVPVRFISENSGAKVEWDNKNYIVKISTSNTDSGTKNEKEVTLTGYIFNLQGGMSGTQFFPEADGGYYRLIGKDFNSFDFKRVKIIGKLITEWEIEVNNISALEDIKIELKGKISGKPMLTQGGPEVFSLKSSTDSKFYSLIGNCRGYEGKEVEISGNQFREDMIYVNSIKEVK